MFWYYSLFQCHFWQKKIHDTSIKYIMMHDTWYFKIMYHDTRYNCIFNTAQPWLHEIQIFNFRISNVENNVTYWFYKHCLLVIDRKVNIVSIVEQKRIIIFKIDINRRRSTVHLDNVLQAITRFRKFITLTIVLQILPLLKTSIIRFK